MQYTALIRLLSLVDGRSWKAIGPDDVLLVRELCGAVRAVVRETKAMKSRAARTRKTIEAGRMPIDVGGTKLRAMDQHVGERLEVVGRACREIFFNALWRFVPDSSHADTQVRTEVAEGRLTMEASIGKLAVVGPVLVMQQWIAEARQLLGVGLTRIPDEMDN